MTSFASIENSYEARALNAHLSGPDTTYAQYLEENDLPPFEYTLLDEERNDFRCRAKDGSVHEDHDWKADGRCSRCVWMLHSFWVAQGGMTEKEFEQEF